MLRRIALKDFKSFDDTGVDLGGLTLLVGANASGKSNLLDALRFLQGISFDYNLSDVLRGRWEGGHKTWPGVRGGSADVVRKTASSFNIWTDWMLEGERVGHSISGTSGDHPLVVEEELSNQDSQYLFNTEADALKGQKGLAPGSGIRVAVRRQGKGNSKTAVYSATRSLLLQVEAGHPVHKDVGRVRDRLVAALRAACFLEIHPALMRDYAPLGAESVGLAGENVSAVTWRMCQDPEQKADLVDWLAELCAPELVDVDFEKTGLGDVMLVLVERGGRRIPARSLSDGTLRFLGELLALRTAPKGSLLLMEEIENGLHPSRTHLLVEAMEAAVRSRGIQVIATSHSPVVLQALSPEALNDAVLAARPPDAEGTRLCRLRDLPHFDEVSERRGVDHLLATGWLERAL